MYTLNLYVSNIFSFLIFSSMDRQDKIFMRLKNQPVRNFWRRELNILFGGSREISKEQMQNWYQVYEFKSNGWAFLFYFKGRDVSFIW